MTYLHDRSRRVFVIPRKTAAWPTAGSAIGFAKIPGIAADPKCTWFAAESTH